MRIGNVLACASVVAITRAATWSLKDTYSGDDYMSKFDYFTDTDPTNGLVVFENEETAKNLNLTYVDDSGNFVLRTDTVEQRTEGRPSVRLQSQASYENAVIMYVNHSANLGCKFLTILRGVLSGQHSGR